MVLALNSNVQPEVVSEAKKVPLILRKKVFHSVKENINNQC